MVAAEPSWDDPSWIEKGDSPWARRLRRHQGWWRQTHTDLAAGPVVGRDRRVVSMLPRGVGPDVNLMTPAAVAAYDAARRWLRETRAPGLIQRERVERNLLSSQPLCFNLFGYLSASPVALLPWVRNWAPGATAVTTVRLEHAPARGTIARSAF